MRIITIILCFAFCGITPVLKAQYPTDAAEISLLSATPGEETYAVFGHSALRIKDVGQGYDIVFNYGTFDFTTEHFYLKFGTGKLMYFLSYYEYKYFHESYLRSGQGIYEQRIHLTNKEKYNLINNLQENSLEENREFRYDFFRDNCATRIRDIIEKSIEGKLIYDTTYITKPESFRDLLSESLNHQPWTIFGLSLMLGKSTDSIAALSDYMFLPVHLKNLYTTARVQSGSDTRMLTSAPEEVLASTIIISKPTFITSPEFIFLLIFLAVLWLSFREYRSKKHYRWLDVFLFTITGFLGLLIFWVWGWSLHIYLHNNLHIVWASPLNIAGVIGLMFWYKRSWVRYYFIFYACLVLLLIAVSLFLTQEVPIASYFLMGIMLVRALRIWFNS